jgi:Repeat of unknown function (DUF5648)
MSFHFYTTSTTELNQVLEMPDAHSEGIACYVRFNSPLYKMQNNKTGHHFYTTSAVAAGIAPYYVDPVASALPQNPDQWSFVEVACEVLLSAAPPNELPTEEVVLFLNPGIGDYLYLGNPTVDEQHGAQDAGYGYLSTPFIVPTGNAGQVVSFNRFLNPINNDHYYSISAVVPPGYHFEIVAFNVFQPTPYATPLYRLRSTVNGDHLYTTDVNELAEAVDLGYVFESVACQVISEPQLNTTPLFRLHNPGIGDHLLTTSEAERINAVAAGYLSEGISCEVYPVQVPRSTPLYRIRLG